MTLRIAVPKGRLFESLRPTLALFEIRTGADRSYRMTSDISGIEPRIVKARAIPQLVGLGIFDVGFCGVDLILEAGAEDETIPIVDLRYDRVEIVAAATSDDLLQNHPRRPLVIATEYPRLAASWALSKGLSHVMLQTYGSTEGYVPEAADIAIDCVSTGQTLRDNGLTVLDRITRSSTHLCVNRRQFRTSNKEFRSMLNTLREKGLPHPEAALVLAKDENGRVLTVTTKWENRGLGLPGGLVETGEGPSQTAIREMIEETGIEPKGEPKFAYFGYAGDRPTIVYAVHASGVPRSSSEGQAAWSDPKTLANLENKYAYFNGLALRAAEARLP